MQAFPYTVFEPQTGPAGCRSARAHYAPGALVIERDQRRQVYPVDDPFAYRQPPRDFVPLGKILPDALAALAYAQNSKLSGGDGAC
jgi:hypothetical protein